MMKRWVGIKYWENNKMCWHKRGKQTNLIVMTWLVSGSWTLAAAAAGKNRMKSLVLGWIKMGKHVCPPGGWAGDNNSWLLVGISQTTLHLVVEVEAWLMQSISDNRCPIMYPSRHVHDLCVRPSEVTYSVLGWLVAETIYFGIDTFVVNVEQQPTSKIFRMK